MTGVAERTLTARQIMIRITEHQELLREVDKQLNSGKVVELKLIQKDNAEIAKLSVVTSKKVFTKKLNK